MEWGEGAGDVWDIWCFESDASFEINDILIIDDADMSLPLVVTRVTATTTLRTKQFHHWEVRCVEHELSVVELLTDAGL